MPSPLRWAALACLVLALILVPFAIWEARALEVATRLLQPGSGRATLSVLVIVLLSVDVLLPIPSSFVSAGAVALLGAWHGAVSVAIGMTAGAWLGYGIGRVGGEPLARRVAGALELERAARMMSRYGSGVLLICRGVPVLAEASTLLAGATRLEAWRFAVVTGLGNAGLAAAYAVIGALQLSGVWLWLAPFLFGVAVPGFSLVALRVWGGAR